MGKPMTKRKILIVLYYYAPYVSGLTVYAVKLAEGLARDGHDVTVLATRHAPDLPRTETRNGVRVIRCGVLARLGKGVISPELLWRAVAEARRHDVVNFHLPFAEAGLATLLIPRHKLLTVYQCDLNLGPSPVQRLVQAVSFALMRVTLWRSRRVVVLSEDYMAHSKMRGFLPKSVAVNPPIETGQFRRVPVSDAFRAKAGIAPGDFVVGFLGRIVYEKGLQYLLGALDHLADRLPNAKIVVGGDYQNVAGGSIIDTLDAYRAKYPDRIAFTGFLTDAEKLEFYSALDVFVLPSIDPLEAFGMVQVEALCCGTPVIATDMPGVRAVVRRTGAGLLVPPRDSRALAAAIVRVAQDAPPRDGFDPADWDIARTLTQYETLF
jgi:glycosyltransferase involved in cell wall biosynthesis